MNNFLEVLKPKKSPDLYKKLADFFSTKEECATFVSSLQRFGVQERSIRGCTEGSIKSCILALAETKLSLLHKECYLVPRGGQLTFDISYIGFCALAYRSGLCDLVVAHPVYKGEEFTVIDGTETRIIHKADIGVDRSDRCLVGVWCKIELSNGRTMVGVLSRSQIDIHRAAFKCGRAWETSFVEMAKKTVIKKLIKTAPKALANIGITTTTVEAAPEVVYDHEKKSLPNPLGWSE